MNTAGDYLTVLQLAVGLNLVVGAYATARVEFEQHVLLELDHCRERMASLKEREPDRPIPDGLETKPVKKLTNRELYRYLIDVSVRMDDRIRRYRKFDSIIDYVLPFLGLICAAALVWASVNPILHVPRCIGIVGSIVLLAPPITAFTKTYFELKTHRKFFQRPPNPSFIEKTHDRNMHRERSKPLPGEIFKVTNRVRNLR